jgi:hypothetical protein
LEDVVYINGPSKIHKFQNQDGPIAGQVIYLMSESHGRDDSCTQPNSLDINDYLVRTLNTVSTPVDFYLESFYNVKSKADSKDLGYIHDLAIEHDFRNKNKLTRKGISRYHYIDVRHTLTSKQKRNIYLENMFIEFKYLMNKTHQEINNGATYVSPDTLSYLQESLVPLFYPNGVKITNSTELFLRLRLSSNIKYQFDKSTIKDKYTSIVQYLEDEISNKSINIWDFVDDKPVKLDTLLSFLNNMQSVIALTVELYTLGRMFKSNESGYNKHVIVYTGFEHARNIFNILKKLGFSVTEESRMVSTRCTDISTLKRPLFS